MQISRFCIKNFKCFVETEIELSSGFNLIVGQNNAGKTALLQALTLGFPAVPNLSTRTLPDPNMVPDATSSAEVLLTMPRRELLRAAVDSDLHFFLPHISQELRDTLNIRDHSLDSLQRFFVRLLERDSFSFNVRVEKAIGRGESWLPATTPSFEGYTAQHFPDAQSVPFAIVRVNRDLTFNTRGVTNAHISSEIGPWVARVANGRIYRFSAERFNLGECPFGNNRVLAPNATNLPEVLNWLQHDQFKLQQFNETVHRIFPQIHHVSVRSEPNNKVQILVWGGDGRRGDLAISLSESGTGIGQVLAILYVVLASEVPQVLLIDEPQSFLHPGAARKLIEVLAEHSEHQYVISTHSPTIISAADPKAVIKLTSNDGVVTREVVDMSRSHETRSYLVEVGARLSDVFGYDNVLWVEGRTEEICFPRVLKDIARVPFIGTAIVAMKTVGDLSRRDAERIFDMYAQLTGGASILPPAIGFILDAECRSEGERRELRHRSGNRARFLPRRMYENYLLHERAIVAVANAIDGFRADPITEDEVSRFIEERKQDPEFFCEAEQVAAASWVNNIDGARVLSQLFSSLSENRVAYDKVKHSPAITDWLIAHAPVELESLAEFLSAALQGT